MEKRKSHSKNCKIVLSSRAVQNQTGGRAGQWAVAYCCPLLSEIRIHVHKYFCMNIMAGCRVYTSLPSLDNASLVCVCVIFLIYSFLTVLDLHCCPGSFSSCSVWASR